MPSIRIYMSCIFRVQAHSSAEATRHCPVVLGGRIPTPPQIRHAVRSTVPGMISVSRLPTD
jgi:hypothetical protein